MVLLLTFCCFLVLNFSSVHSNIVCFGVDCYKDVDLIQGFSGPGTYSPVIEQRCNYCNLGQQNTYCQYQNKPGPNAFTCGRSNQIVSGVDKEQRENILKIHNDLRRKVARGEEPKISGRHVATNMYELQWSDELAKGAQLWANQCRFSHDNPRICKYYVGQNLYISGGFDANTEPEWEKAIRSWYDEVNDFYGSSVTYFNPSFSSVTGHFTQIIWAETVDIGCGYISYPSNSNFFSGQQKYYVCNYGPGGNMIGASIYGTKGRVCSACPRNSKCVNSLCRPNDSTMGPDDEGDVGASTTTELPLCRDL